MTTTSTLAEEVLEVGRRVGLDEVATCSAEPFTEARRLLEQRRDEGLHGGMQFTYRNPARSTDPSATLPGARSLVVGALRYDTDVPPPPPAPAGRVARYATEDHYGELRRALTAVRDHLRAAGHRAVVVADDNALVDRAAAVRAGIGWYGKSSNVLVPRRGSWFVLGSVITDAELGASRDPVPDGCGACRRCLDGCPTGAIVAPGVVDAGRCLSWHLQVTGDFPRQHRAALGDRIYGCDECQEVCPPSRRDARDGGTAGDGGAAGDAVPVAAPGAGAPGSWVDLRWMLTASDDELLGALGRWYVPRRDPRYLRRNALVVLGNTADPTAGWVRDVLAGHLDGDDDLLARHAAWAACALGLRGWLEEGGWDRRPAVAEELAAVDAGGDVPDDRPADVSARGARGEDEGR